MRRILNVGRVADRSADRETRVRRSAGWPIVQQTVASETTTKQQLKDARERSQPVYEIIASEGPTIPIVGRLARA